MIAHLALEDGFILRGRSFTGACDHGGEVIFNTGMTGYQEILTDPSYTGQMVCLTWPLAGNYGINPEDMESERVHVAGLLVKECCRTPSNWRSTESLPDFLVRHGVPGIEGLDTRALTRHLRDHGVMRGVISTTCSDLEELVLRAKALPSMEGQNLVPRVAPHEPWIMTDSGPHPAPFLADGSVIWPTMPTPEGRSRAFRVIVYDYGIKWNIVRLLQTQGFSIVMVPPAFPVEAVRRAGADAVFLSNGPGDPAMLGQEIEIVRELAASWPVAGICLGHQLLGHALGGKTHKLKFGHHGLNHPVQDLDSGRVEISSQNHGFCVDVAGLDHIRVTHINLNDGTLEGFTHASRPIIAVQHHPEACPGPSDSHSFFARFEAMVRASAA